MTWREIVVVGGGLIGSLVAFTLRRAGLDVLVLDSGRPGAAWRAAAGLLTPDGERLHGTPLYADAVDGLRRWPALAAALEDSGGVAVAFREGVRRQQSDGRCEVTAGEASLHPPSVVAAARSGLEVLHAHVSGLHAVPGGVWVQAGEQGWHGRHVVLAGGVWSAALGVPVRPVQGQALLLRGPVDLGAVYGPPRRGFSRYALARPDGVYVGATARASAAVVPDARAGRWLRGVARELVPGVTATPAGTVLLGLRPVMPTGRPLVQPHPTVPGVTVATGHGRHGALLAPNTAARVLALVQAGIRA